jgi:hypothetical protein
MCRQPRNVRQINRHYISYIGCVKKDFQLKKKLSESENKNGQQSKNTVHNYHGYIFFSQSLVKTPNRAKLDPAPCPPAFTITVAAIRGGPNRTTPGELLPAPTFAFVVLLQKPNKTRDEAR